MWNKVKTWFSKTKSYLIAFGAGAGVVTAVLGFLHFKRGADAEIARDIKQLQLGRDELQQQLDETRILLTGTRAEVERLRAVLDDTESNLKQLGTQLLVDEQVLVRYREQVAEDRSNLERESDNYRQLERTNRELEKLIQQIEDGEPAS